jgi:CspA family cold shock protein
MSLIGNVKWFNSKKGFGFINVMTPDNENTSKDYFVHFSNITTSGYKRLFPGEYVSFNLGKNNEGKAICIDVMGVHGGPLLTDNETHRYKIFPKMRDDNENNDNENNDNQ